MADPFDTTDLGFDPTAPDPHPGPDPQRRHYMHIRVGNERLRPVAVPEPVYRLLRRFVDEFKKHVADEHKKKGGNTE